MDSLINENYHILNMIHDTVKPLGNGYYFCTDKGIKSVIDEYGNEVLKGESIINIGEFIYSVESNFYRDYTVMMYNFKTRSKRKFTALSSDLKQLNNCGNYLTIRVFNNEINMDCLAIINSRLNIVGYLPFAYNAYFSKRDSTGIWINYLGMTYNLTKYAHINEISESIDVYCSTELDNGIELISTELTDTRIYIADLDTSNIIESVEFRNFIEMPYKFKIAKNGNIINNKSYKYIRKVNILEDSGYLTHNVCGNKIKIGLLNSNCKEILDCKYDSIEPIGNGNYKVIDDDIAFIFNENTMQKSLDYKKDDIIIHSTLPITLIKKTDEVIVLDGYGRLFNIIDIAKYFKCSYSQENPTYLRFDFDYGSKYVDNRLTPITNMHTIASLACNNWISM